VAEGARLESVYTGNRIVGSNPTPSARPQPICVCPRRSASAIILLIQYFLAFGVWTRPLMSISTAPHDMGRGMGFGGHFDGPDTPQIVSG
jgi:hypothetical protein